MAQLKLVTLAMIKAAMKVSANSPATVDTAIDQIILGVSLDFEKQTGRGVDYIARTEYFDVEEYTNKLLLKGYPVSELDGEELIIYQDLDRSFADASIVDSSYYFLDAAEGDIDLFRKYPTGVKTIKVIYKGGMAKMTDPDSGSEIYNLYPDVAEAVIHEVITQYKLRPQLGAASIKIGKEWTTIFKPMARTPLYKKMIVNYMRGQL